MRFYDRVHTEFEEDWRRRIVGQREAVKIINKLCRRFKLPKVRVEFTKRRPYSGHYLSPKYSPRLCMDYYCEIHLQPEYFSFGLVAEEVAHHMDYMKNGPTNGRKTHTKKLVVMMRRLLKFCKKRDYWGHRTMVIRDPRHNIVPSEEDVEVVVQ